MRGVRFFQKSAVAKSNAWCLCDFVARDFVFPHPARRIQEQENHHKDQEYEIHQFTH
jgi:hypothetical protein